MVVPPLAWPDPGPGERTLTGVRLRLAAAAPAPRIQSNPSIVGTATATTTVVLSSLVTVESLKLHNTEWMLAYQASQLDDSEAKTNPYDMQRPAHEKA